MSEKTDHQFPRFSDAQMDELFQLALRVDRNQVVTYERRRANADETDAPWFVWVAMGEHRLEMGRSKNFRFIASNISKSVDAVAVTEAIDREMGNPKP